jgi:hypothetical protein
MNAQQATLFQQLLEEACDHHLDDGGTIVSSQFGGDGSQCPMRCLFGSVGSDVMAQEAGTMLGITITVEDIWAIIWAFDNRGYLNLSSVSASLIGQNLRAKYIKE